MNKRIATFLLIWLLGGVPFLRAETDSYRSSDGMRPVTVKDFIEMTELGHFQAFNGSPVANFSPDGREFVVVVRKGDLSSNTIRYSILLWSAIRLLDAHPPFLVLTMESSSNRPAIRDVSWLPDNET